MKIPRELRPVARLAKQQGWTIETTGGGHLKWRAPHGASVITPASPSDRRGHRNDLANLRRHGLLVAA